MPPSETPASLLRQKLQHEQQRRRRRQRQQHQQHRHQKQHHHPQPQQQQQRTPLASPSPSDSSDSRSDKCMHSDHERLPASSSATSASIPATATAPTSAPPPTTTTHAALAALLAGYCAHADARRWRAWGDLFTPDAEAGFEYWCRLRGRAQLVSCAAAGAALCYDAPPARSFWTDVVFELGDEDGEDADRAWGMASLWYDAHAWGGGSDCEGLTNVTPDSGVGAGAGKIEGGSEGEDAARAAGLSFGGPYEFEFARTEGEEWKIKSMNLRVLCDRREEVDRRCTRCDCIPASGRGTPCP